MPQDNPPFWALFADDDQIVFSHLNGMAYMFDTQKEARIMQKMLAKFHKQRLTVKPCHVCWTAHDEVSR